MSEAPKEVKKKIEEVNPQEKFEQAEAGKGAPGKQTAVQTAQTTAVNPPDAEIPANTNKEKNIQEVKAEKAQEEGTGATTTDGYTIEESGRLDNMPIEPEMYTEEK